MASNVPVVRQIAWISLIPQLIFMGFLMFVWYLFDAPKPYFNGALTYLVFSFSLRTFIPHYHVKGMKLNKEEQFLEAISCFEKSYQFFTNYAWIDKYRYLVLLSSSKASYKEMALVNIAFCYGQLGNIAKSKEYYEQTLREFPDSGIAKVALRFLINVIKEENK